MGRTISFDYEGHDITCMKVFDALAYPCNACNITDCPDREMYDNEVIHMSMYERVKNMTQDEMNQFVYWIYMCGNKDGQDGCCDSPSNSFFGGHMLTLPANELMPNDNTDDLWDRFEEAYNKKTE